MAGVRQSITSAAILLARMAFVFGPGPFDMPESTSAPEDASIDRATGRGRRGAR
jgi:hypothetical protein